MSFIAKKATKAKKATPRAFRFSTNPYSGLIQPGAANESSTTKGYFSTSKTFLKPASVSLGPQAMETREKHRRQDYEEQTKGYSSEQHSDLQAIQQEIGWGPQNDSYKQDWKLPGLLDMESHPTNEAEDDWVTDDDEADVGAIPRILGTPVYTRTWAQRLANEQLTWRSQLPLLCDSYLSFYANGPPNVESNLREQYSAEPNMSFEIDCVFLTERRKCSFLPLSSLELTTVTLMRHGFFCPTPTLPKLAIHVDVLRFAVALRQHASALSIQAIGMALSDIYNQPYSPQLRTHLSNAIDVYLAIRRMIGARLNRVLERDDPDWQLRNACAACTYKLDDEPEMKYAMILTMDGNDSLKRVASSASVDKRILTDGLILDTEYVNRFENEVKSQAGSANNACSEIDDSPKETPDAPSSFSQVQPPSNLEADSDESHFNSTTCEERWKNAKADENARHIVKFEETGIFAACCRHDTLLVFTDMKNSGELAKYGIAIVDKLITVFGKKLLFGYDIGCTFEKTIGRSPLVGPRVREHSTEFCVGSFHGYGHNRLCQLSYHPLYRAGVGQENMESCERLFASSNAAAITTRHASPFHRRQHIVLHMTGWNASKRRSLGSILKHKYISALKIVQTAPALLRKLDPTGNEETWLAYTHSEREYYQNLINPPPSLVFPIVYVRRLRILSEKRRTFEEVFAVKFAHGVPELIDQYINHPTIQNTKAAGRYQEIDAKSTRAIETKRRLATDQLLAIQTEVAHLENEHNIDSRWVPGSPEWKDAEEMEKLVDFHNALDNLERATVQRLRELERANVSGTGYKLRVYIGKAIARREKALHTALHAYNSAAQQTDPARPTLTFEKLVECTYLSNFDFLRQSRHGVQTAEWGKPTNSQCGKEAQALARAREEITRLNIEIRRVITQISDEEKFLKEKLEELERNNDPIAYQLRQHYELTVEVNKVISRDIHSIAKLPGFSGSLSRGVRFGSVLVPDSVENVTPVDVPVDRSQVSETTNRAITPHPENHNAITGVNPAIEYGTSVEDEADMELTDDQTAQLVGLEQSWDNLPAAPNPTGQEGPSLTNGATSQASLSKAKKVQPTKRKTDADNSQSTKRPNIIQPRNDAGPSPSKPTARQLSKTVSAAPSSSIVKPLLRGAAPSQLPHYIPLTVHFFASLGDPALSHDLAGGV